MLRCRDEGIGYLRGHEGQLIVDMASDNFGVDNKAGGDVV